MDQRTALYVDEEISDQFAQLGAIVATEERAAAQDSVEVWQINWDAFCLFLDCETQWRTAGTMAGVIWTGLDYAAVDVVMRRTAPGSATFEDLRILETEALDVFREQTA